MDLKDLNWKKLSKWIAYLIPSIILLGYGVLSYNLNFCLNNNRGFAIGEIQHIRGRDINDVEYAEYQFSSKEKVAGCSGSSQIISGDLPEDYKNSIEIGDKFLVVFCKETIFREKCNSSTMLFKFPIPDSVQSVNQLDIDSSEITVSLWNL